MRKTLGKRKDLRLKGYAYSTAGAYFGTIRIKEGFAAMPSVMMKVGDGAIDIPKDMPNMDEMK